MGLRGCVVGGGFLMAVFTAWPALAQRGGGALIFCHDGTTCDADTFHQLATVLSDAGAAPATQVRELPQDLTPYRLIFAMAPVADLSIDHENRIVSFYGEGGHLVLASEAVGYSAGASRSFNRITTNLSYGAVLEEKSYDSLCIKYASVVADDPINAGVAQLMYAYSTGIVSMSLSPAARGESGQVLIATGERLVVVADTNPFSDYCGVWSADGNTRLVQNIWANAVGGADYDGDGIPDAADNCFDVYNPDQSDRDGDGTGDACDDTDTDGDGYLDVYDNCPATYNPDQNDIDGDFVGDACDEDVDGDLVPNVIDNCYTVYNPDQRDLDRDSGGDACDGDIDGDGLANTVDPCPYDARNLCGAGGSGLAGGPPAGGVGGVGATGGFVTGGIGATGGFVTGGVGATGGFVTGGVGATGGFGAVGATGGFGATGAVGGFGATGGTSGNGGSSQGATGGVAATGGGAGEPGDDEFVELSGRGCGCGIARRDGVSRAGLAALVVALAFARRRRTRVRRGQP